MQIWLHHKIEKRRHMDEFSLLEVRDAPFETPITAIFSPLPDGLSLRTSLFSCLGVDITLELG